MKSILFLLFTTLFAMQGWGQTFLSENFNGGSMPSIFTLVNGACGWVVTENGSSAWWSVPAGNGYYAIINDDACGNGQNNSNVWMKLPSMDLSSTTTLSLNFNSCVRNSLGDITLVKVSIDGGTTWTDHTVPNGNGTAWVPVTIDLTAYCGNADVIVAFYYSDLGNWFYGWAVDDIVIAAPWANDLTAVSLLPYNMVTGQAQVPYFTLKNRGLTAVTSSDYTIQLTDGGSYTQTISGVDLAIDQDTTIAFPAYTAATLGAMTLTATITYAADLYAADNTISSMGQVYDLPVYDYNAYALNTTNGTYYSFDVFNSALTSAGTGIPTTPFPMSETWVGDKIARVYSDGSFGYVLANGTFVKIGDLISPVEAQPVSLAYNRTNSILYVLGIGASNTAHLGTVNLASLEVAAVGNTNNTQSIIGIDFADDGYLYGPALGNDKLYKIDPSDATTTAIGNVGVDLLFEQDVAYDYVTHKLYSYVYVNGVGVKYGYYNLNTGSFIEVAPIAITGQYTCITIITNTLPACGQVTGIMPSEITATTATISWFPPANIPANGYEYYLSTSATAPTAYSTATGTASDTVVYLQDLTPNITYCIWVRSNCGSDVSAWSNFSASFTTPCEAITTFPFKETFEANSVSRSCWKIINANSDGDAWTFANDSYYAHGGTYSAQIYISYNTDNNNDWLISPPITLSGAGAPTLKYWYRASNTYETDAFEVLVSTIGNQPADFTDTILPLTQFGNTTYQETILDLSAYNSTIYIAWHVSQGGPYGYYNIDDVAVVDLNCMVVDNFAIQNLTSVSADIHWADTASPSTSWHVELYSTAQENPSIGGGDIFTTTVSETFVNLIDLNPTTFYYVYVKNDCGWSSYSFQTPCVAITTFPFKETFEANSVSRSCWKIINANSDGDAWTFANNSSYAHGGTYSAQIYTYGNGGNNNDWLISPPITLSGAGAPTLKYWYSARSTYEPDAFEVLVSTTGNQPANFTDTILPLTQFGNTTYQETILDLSAYNSTIYIAWHVPQDGPDGYYINIDDVAVVDLNCMVVDNFAIQNLTSVSANIHWADTASPSTSWHVELYSTAQENPSIGGGDIFTTTVSETFVNLIDLNSTTFYYVYVKNDCGWSSYSFQTPCEAITTFPFKETFEANSVSRSCWKIINANSDGVAWTFANNSSYAHGGTYSAQIHTIYNIGNNNDWLISPPITLSGASAPTLKYWYRARSTYAPDAFEVLVSTTGNQPANFTDTILPLTQFGNTTYQETILDLSAYNSTIYIAWHVPQGGPDGYYINIDDVTVIDLNCMPVNAFVAQNLTATSANITWSDDNSPSTSWHVELYSTAQSNPSVGGGNILTTTVSDTGINITDLTPVTTYYLYVKNDCNWSGYSFTTPCIATSIPYTQNFDANTNMPSCWNMFGSFEISTENPISPPNTLRFNGYATSIAVLPIFDVDVNTAKISFVLRKEDMIYSGTMDIGYLADITNANSFVAVMTDILTIEGVNTPFDTALSAFPAGIKNIAFRQTTSMYLWYYWLDNVCVYDPNCVPVNAFAAQNITDTSADITWSDDNSPSTSWHVELYSTAQSNPTVGGGNILTTTVSNTGINITDLTMVTTYYLYVKNDCGWSGYSFTTPCIATSIPYTQNFDANTNMPSCWNMFGSFVDISTSYSTSPPNTLRFRGGGTTIAVLPIFDVDVNTAKISFILRRSSMSYSGPMDIGYLTDITNANSFVAVMTDILTVEGVNTPFDTALSAFPAGIKNIAFRQTASGYWLYWLDNVFVYDPNCVPVNAFVAQNITATSADITWSDDNSPSTSWHVELYSTAQSNPIVGGGNILTTTVSDTGINITDLTPATTYYLYVKNDCGWSGYSFTTPCMAASIPYVQNFDANSVIPSCWNTFGSLAIVAGGYPPSPPNTLRFNGGATNIAVLPIFDVDVNTAKISFVLRRESIIYSGQMDIGYLTDISDASSFVAVMTNILIVANVNTPFDTVLSAFPAGIKNIAFRQTAYGNNWGYWLDNINVYDFSCVPVTAFAAQNLTPTSVDITWSDNNSPSTSWHVELYSTAQSNPTVGGGNILTTTVSNTGINITDLTPATTYYLYVKNDCGWSGYSFTTPCIATSIPYTQNFDTNTNMPSCWITFGSFEISTTNPTSEPHTLRFSGVRTNIAVLPIFDVDVNTAKISFVLRREDMNLSGPMDIGYLTNISDANSFVAVMTNILTVERVNTPFDITLSAFPAGIKNIAFRQTTAYSYWYWLDNVCVYDLNCVPVTAFAAQNITATSADITWSDDNSPSTSWHVELYSTAQSNPTVGGGNILTTTVSNTGINITDLTMVTTYYLYVKNDCGWSDYSFTTPCMAMSIPYTQNFDANTNMPSCWITFGSFWFSTINSTSPPNTLMFAGGGTNIAVLPIFDVDVNTAKISFVLRRQSMSYSGTMDIGYLTDISDTNSFVAVMTDILTVEEVNTPFDTALSAFPAGIKNIVFRQTASDYWYYWLDNVNVYAAPNTCSAPTALNHTTLIPTAATITWTAGDAETEWQVTWKEAAASDWNNPVGVAATTYDISGLTAATDYNVRVRAICGEADTSDWSVVATFTTTTSNIPTNTEITANSLQLYPNPTTGELKIKNYKLREGDKIEIYNVLGQKQQLTTDHYPLTTINVSHLSAGMYTVKIGGYVGKFVKK